MKFKIFSIFFIYSIIFSGAVFAQEAKKTAPATASKSPAPAPVQTVTLATVNIQDAKILSQEGSTLRIAFNLSNREGLQTGVKYAVLLVLEKGKEQFVVDEKVYDESLTLPENSSTKREITYTAPAMLDGTYTVLIKSSNENGFPFGLTVAGKATVTATKSVEIVPDSCKVGIQDSPSLVPLLKGLIITQAQSLRLNCTVVNHTNREVIVTPTYKTTYRSEFGPEVETAGGDTTPLTFAPEEKRTIELTLPKASRAQTYAVAIALRGPDAASNTVGTHYTISGANATISNLSFDRDYYKKGDTARLQLLASSSIPNATLVMEMKNNKGRICADPLTQPFSQNSKTPLFEVLLPVTRDCFNPAVTVTMTDDKGTVLDQKTFKATTTSFPAPKHIARTFLIILGLLVAVVAYVYFRKKRISTALAIFVLVVGFSIIPFQTAKADTFAIGPDLNLTATVNIDNSSYVPGTSITATGSIYSNAPNADTVSLQATTTGNPLASLINSTITQGATVYGNVSLTAPGTPGSYSVAFTAGVNVVTLPTVTGVSCYQAVYGGGQVNDSIECSVFLDIGPSSTVSVGVQYTTGYRIDAMGVDIFSGNTSGSSNSRMAFADEQVYSYCIETWQPAEVNVDPSVRC